METFRKAFPGSDAVVQKCAGFFLNAAQEAGITIGKRVLKGRKSRAPSGKKRAPRPKADSSGKSTGNSKPEDNQLPPQKRKVSEILLEHFKPNEMTDEQQNAIWILLRYFKEKGN